MAAALPIDYQAIFRSLPGSYLLLAADGTILNNSDQHVASSMLPREQAVGRTIFAAYPSAPEGQHALALSHENVRRTRQPDVMPLVRYDLERPAAQGGGTEERYWQITHYPLLDAQGEVQYILQIPQDVTEQQRAAQATAEAQAKLAEEQARTLFILESLPAFIWTTTPAGAADYFNPRWLAFTGRSLADELGGQWASNMHPDDQARVRDIWQRCLATGEPFQAEYRLRRADGEYHWLLARAAPRRTDEGTITMWVGGATDIHEQKLMVQELLDTNEQQAIFSEQAYDNYQQAQQQRQTLYGLLMEAPALVGILRGPEHRYEFTNTHFLQLVGNVELVGRTVAEAFPDAQTNGLLALLDRVYHTGETHKAQAVPMRVGRRDGSEPLREAYLNFIYRRFYEDGQAAGITVYGYDVTELVETRRALERLLPQ